MSCSFLSYIYSFFCNKEDSVEIIIEDVLDLNFPSAEQDSDSDLHIE